MLSLTVEETLRHLVRISFFPLMVLSLIGRDLFTVVFGRQWAEAGVYSQVLAPWALVWFLSSRSAQY